MVKVHYYLNAWKAPIKEKMDHSEVVTFKTADDITIWKVEEA